jgi:hypothetical protein
MTKKVFDQLKLSMTGNIIISTPISNVFNSFQESMSIDDVSLLTPYFVQDSMMDYIEWYTTARFYFQHKLPDIASFPSHIVGMGRMNDLTTGKYRAVGSLLNNCREFLYSKKKTHRLLNRRTEKKDKYAGQEMDNFCPKPPYKNKNQWSFVEE